MKPTRKASAGVLKERLFLESLSRRCPQDVEVLKALGDLYTRTGLYEEGLKTDLELTRLRPQEALAWYNLACSCALLGRTEEAFTALERAIALGYRNVRWLRADRDLSSLKKDQRFIALLQRLARETSAPPKP